LPCLLELPRFLLISLAISCHCFCPLSATKALSKLSSSKVHGVF
jgi:hypothetical protein